MSATTIDARSTATRAVSTTRTRQLRPGHGGGRGTRPVARSTSGVGAPEIGRRRQLRPDARSCRSEHGRPAPVSIAPSGAVSAGWRLTSRGIALVLIVGALFAVAALTVITATAVTVTSDTYHQHGSALSHR